MAPQATGLPVVLIGGEFSDFSRDEGNYHIVVKDASISEAQTGRSQFVFDLEVANDPNHAALEGKKLMSWYQSLPIAKDEPERNIVADTPDKIKMLNGMVKRLCYDGFGIAWPTKPERLDPRKWIGKRAYVQLRKRKDDPTRTQVNSVAQKADELPKLPVMKKAAPVPAGKKAAPAGAASAKTAKADAKTNSVEEYEA